MTQQTSQSTSGMLCAPAKPTRTTGSSIELRGTRDAHRPGEGNALEVVVWRSHRPSRKPCAERKNAFRASEARLVACGRRPSLEHS